MFLYYCKHVFFVYDILSTLNKEKVNKLINHFRELPAAVLHVSSLFTLSGINLPENVM